MSEIKPIYDDNRVKLADVVPLNTPYSVYLSPTSACNFKCIYCAHSLGLSEMIKRYGFVKETMTLDTYKKAVEQLSRFPEKIKLLSLTGHGEPLLNKNIAQMVKIAKESNAFERVEIISNGSLLSKDMSNNLISSGLDTIKISMQGISSLKYKEICKAKIDFERFMENINYFYKNKKKTNLFIKILDIALEKDEEEKFYDLFSGCSDRMFIEKVQKTYDGVKATDGLDINYDRQGRVIKKRKVCPLAFFMLGIQPNGNVKPCDSVYIPAVFGNVNSGSITDMWHSKRHLDFWKLQLTKKRYTNKYCSVCCAPDDVSQPEDVLDEYADIILERLPE
ncbi:MAG: radical SAM protein [Desulfobacteraceae bacterium]|jgi:radical SAM protein with 4Fe4S-binding SPASM domain